MNTEPIKWILFGLFSMLYLVESAAQTSRLLLQVEGIKSQKGHIAVLLFNQAKGFPGEPKHSLRQASQAARKGKVEFVFESLPAGVYAISVIHDENGNQKLDANLLGIPTEGYGFSNNARKLFRAPRFSEAEFRLEQAKQEVSIKLGY